MNTDSDNDSNDSVGPRIPTASLIRTQNQSDDSDEDGVIKLPSFPTTKNASSSSSNPLIHPERMNLLQASSSSMSRTNSFGDIPMSLSSSSSPAVVSGRTSRGPHYDYDREASKAPAAISTSAGAGRGKTSRFSTSSSPVSVGVSKFQAALANYRGRSSSASYQLEEGYGSYAAGRLDETSEKRSSFKDYDSVPVKRKNSDRYEESSDQYKSYRPEKDDYYRLHHDDRFENDAYDRDEYKTPSVRQVSEERKSIAEAAEPEGPFFPTSFNSPSNSYSAQKDFKTTGTSDIVITDTLVKGIIQTHMAKSEGYFQRKIFALDLLNKLRKLSKQYELGIHDYDEDERPSVSASASASHSYDMDEFFESGKFKSGSKSHSYATDEGGKFKSVPKVTSNLPYFDGISFAQNLGLPTPVVKDLNTAFERSAIPILLAHYERVVFECQVNLDNLENLFKEALIDNLMTTRKISHTRYLERSRANDRDYYQDSEIITSLEEYVKQLPIYGQALEVFHSDLYEVKVRRLEKDWNHSLNKSAQKSVIVKPIASASPTPKQSSNSNSSNKSFEGDFSPAASKKKPFLPGSKGKGRVAALSANPFFGVGKKKRTKPQKR